MECRDIKAVLLLAFSLLGSDLAAQTADERALWNEPVEPFRIFGPLYYVGAREVASYAIATPEGLILLDGGLPETAERIAGSLAKLGHSIRDVKILLNSHAHFDHAGGLAELKQKSGARFIASERDAPQLEAGGKGDFAWGDRHPFTPIKVDDRLKDRETVSLGGVTLTAHLTAGHTKGCTTWTGTFEEGGESLHAVFVCSTSVPDPENYRLAGNPLYPEIAADYTASFARLEVMPCDLFLGAHGSFFGLLQKAERLRSGDRRAFVDPEGLRSYVEHSARRFRALLTAARGGDAGGLSFLDGAWVMEDGGVTTEEQWTSAAGGALIGLNKTVRGGAVVGFEFMRIAKGEGNVLTFFASPGGRAATPFKVAEQGERRVVFEKPDHDFPQRVIYELEADGRLLGRIEGEINGKPEAMEWRWVRRIRP